MSRSKTKLLSIVKCPRIQLSFGERRLRAIWIHLDLDSREFAELLAMVDVSLKILQLNAVPHLRTLPDFFSDNPRSG